MDHRLQLAAVPYVHTHNARRTNKTRTKRSTHTPKTCPHVSGMSAAAYEKLFPVRILV